MKAGERAPAVWSAAAAWLGACTLAYEVLWSRVLRYFVDTSLASFAIVLSAFLCGIAAGSALAGRYAGARRDFVLSLAATQIGAGLTGVLSLEAVARTTAILAAVQDHVDVATTFHAQAAMRFVVFAATLLVPTSLLGAAFPVLALATAGSMPLGRLYAAHTAGGVAGSLFAGFVLLPALGVQKSLLLVGGGSVAVGIGALLLSGLPRALKRNGSLAAVALLAAFVALVRPNAVLSVYTERYAPPGHELLYLREDVGSTTAVFRQSGPKGEDRRYLVIDGRGEVSTDYYSMRAFRFLALLPAFYAPRAASTLVVTFGSGIVAGTLASVPDVEDEECVEICRSAFEAARFFAPENHGVLDNPKVHRLVGDGRQYVAATPRRYDVISADATHPRSGDSWVLYTKEFYDACADRLSDGGVMSQWVPMHGVSEGDFRSILKTFHAAFPFVSVYYTGGQNGVGHLVLLGSKQPLRIDVPRAERLFAVDAVRSDLADVNVLDLPDLFAGFVFDETAVEAFAADAPWNTDDRPVLAFGGDDGPARSWLAALASRRQKIFPHLSGLAPEQAPGIEQGLAAAFDATGHALKGQIFESDAYTARMALDPDRRDEGTRRGIERSRRLLSRAIEEYTTALRSNPRDAHTTYLLRHVAAEAQSLEAVTR